MEAARMGETGVVKKLVEGGADLNLQNKVCCFDVMYTYKITDDMYLPTHYVGMLAILAGDVIL